MCLIVSNGGIQNKIPLRKAEKDTWASGKYCPHDSLTYTIYLATQESTRTKRHSIYNSQACFTDGKISMWKQPWTPNDKFLHYVYLSTFSPCPDTHFDHNLKHVEKKFKMLPYIAESLMTNETEYFSDICFHCGWAKAFVLWCWYVYIIFSLSNNSLCPWNQIADFTEQTLQASWF